MKLDEKRCTSVVSPELTLLVWHRRSCIFWRFGSTVNVWDENRRSIDVFKSIARSVHYIPRIHLHRAIRYISIHRLYDDTHGYALDVFLTVVIRSVVRGLNNELVELFYVSRVRLRGRLLGYPSPVWLPGFLYFTHTWNRNRHPKQTDIDKNTFRAGDLPWLPNDRDEIVWIQASFVERNGRKRSDHRTISATDNASYKDSWYVFFREKRPWWKTIFRL